MSQTNASAPLATRPFRAIQRAAFARPAFGGVFVGALFWLASLAPTLMPRTATTQAAAAGLCLAIGYGIGTLGGAFGHALLNRFDRAPGAIYRQNAWRVLLVLCVLGIIAGCAFWLSTQRTQRHEMTMEALSPLAAVIMVPLSLVVAGIFVTLARGIRGLARMFNRLLRRFIPERIASPAAVGLVVILGLFVVWPALTGRFDSWANSSFATVDDTTSPGTRQPQSVEVSGSPNSLVHWDNLGRHGRDFVAHATSLSELRTTHTNTSGLQKPVRVYVGLGSGSTNAQRARLAVRELERTKAFDRKVLVVVTSTGSGWVDPNAATALEELYGGDTAIVSQQYSYLPSWIATLLEPQASGEAASALFEAVHAKWATFPQRDRPKLVVFGLSLGSYGTEQEFAGPTLATSLANLTSRTDGALLVGATATNPIWRQATDARDPSSPVWRPVVNNGKVVRFDGRSPTLRGIDKTWKAPRVLYVQHASDPVTFWNESWLWSKPEIMEAPRGDAITASTWFPIITGVQGVFDLMAGFGAPPGFGHDYRLDYVRAWAQVIPPAGWTDAKTKALESKLHHR